ncbi:AMP-binding protein [Streptomyces roseochromogenus]|uniref:AMP-binding protein n=1 Tax=Streptomyces roseochromogenus TaxID=285450 RepID=UPI00131A042E|nr:AMP-binding protein [Streptomyces roseochromogenus]
MSKQAGRTPQATAVTQERATRAAALSQSISRHAPAGTAVAIDTDSALNAALAIVAAGRSGCTVLPLNLQSPPMHRVLVDALPSLVVHADAGGVFSVTRTGLGPGAGHRLEGIASVMYNSGSTGRPRGMLVSHDALLARLAVLAAVPGLEPGESVLAMTALSFDISLAELLLPLTVGASFVATTAEVRGDPDTFTALVAKCRPDVTQATRSFWRLATAGGWPGAPGSRIWCGGEALTPQTGRPAPRLLGSSAPAGSCGISTARRRPPSG